MDIDKILAEREKAHGAYKTHAEISQWLKNVLRYGENWDRMPAPYRESLEMIMHKVARILNGNIHHEDSWMDIAGYAMLIVRELERDRKGEKIENGDT